MKREFPKKSRTVSRRDLFLTGGAAGVLSAVPVSAAAPTRAEPPPDVYTRLGVKPFINCTATLTINGGSRQLPEVIEAIEQAAHYHVDLDELMEGAGKRLSELLQVEWAMVTCGAASALSHATVACIAGTDPERMKQIPDLTGLKNEVIVPKSSQNEYFHAVRATGVRMVEVDSLEELESALGPQTAMVIVLGTRWDKPRLSLAEVAPVAKRAGVPVLVDAAADYLVVPNPYIADGADMVAYSGGKIIRGPQTAGLLIGRQDLIRAAFANSAPHHAFGRMMKVSKEEIVGMVTAVEVWFSKRNLDSEYKEWEGWYDHISKKVQAVDGVTTQVRPPGRGSPFPALNVEWDETKIGLTSGEVGDILLGGSPRIMTHASGDGHSLLIRPAAMKPEEYKIVADRLAEIFRSAPKPKEHSPAPPAAELSGRWDVEMKFVRGQASHMLFLEARGNSVEGTHVGTRQRTDMKGTVDGDKVRLRSSMPFQGTRVAYDFEGTISADRMSGTVKLGEYPSATWTAVRRRTSGSA
jgi:L-seryl-tRNA(Ser) seleniumtransferase